MSKKFWAILGSVMTLLAFTGVVWGVSTFWYGYCTKEELHELDQASKIEEARETALIAMQQSRLVIAQQRAAWLEEQLVYYERTHGCVEHQQTSTCNGRVYRTYKRYLHEYLELQKEINAALRK